MLGLSLDVGTAPTVGLQQHEGSTIVSSTLMLVLYNQTTLPVDASTCTYRLEAVLLQDQADGDIKPISYISRSLSPMKERYTQIEKNALAFTHHVPELVNISQTWGILTNHFL